MNIAEVQATHDRLEIAGRVLENQMQALTALDRAMESLDEHDRQWEKGYELRGLIASVIVTTVDSIWKMSQSLPYESRAS